MIAMAARDIYHDNVKNALIKDNWTITHDPFTLRFGRKRLYADLGAERLISAEKGQQKIVVEIKSFVGLSDIKDLEQALGQYVLYRQLLDELEPERRLYLAVTTQVFKSVFEAEIGQLLLNKQVICLLVFEAKDEVIVQWIPE